MGEVISVDFVNKAKLKPSEVINIDPDFIDQFRGILVRTGCTEAQINNVMQGIHDYNHYLTMDDITKSIVDLFIDNTRHIKW